MTGAKPSIVDTPVPPGASAAAPEGNGTLAQYPAFQAAAAILAWPESEGWK